jgi:hypothetical protein
LPVAASRRRPEGCGSEPGFRVTWVYRARKARLAPRALEPANARYNHPHPLLPPPERE